MTTIDSSQILFSMDADTPLKGVSRKPEEPGGSSGFAEVFAGLQLPAPRQPAPDLAANPLLLQRVELSPAMQLIMPAAPSPDLASLQAFARTQGFDEQAIRQLLGDGQVEPGPVEPGLVGANSSALFLAKAAKDPSLAMAQSQAGMTAVPPPALAAVSSSDPPTANSVVGVNAPAAAVALAGVALSGLPSLGLALTDEPGAETLPSSTPLPGLLPPGMLRAVQSARPAGAAAEPNAPGKTAWAQPVEVISLDLMAADAPVDPQGLPPGGLLKGLDGGQAGMLRSWLLPKDTAAPLSDAVSTSTGLAVVSRAVGATTIMAGDLARLDPATIAAAESAWGDDRSSVSAGLLPQLLQTEVTTGNEVLATASRSQALQEATAVAARAPAEATPPTESSQARADQLAQKMGEAIAQRLMSRLEQGNWQFRFVLNPKNMGEVQVNLHMQAGGLDGSFVASQAATRDLLSDGLQRLRETLNAAGMNVASLDVGAGNSSRQGQQSMAAADPQPSNGFRAQTPGTQDGPVAARHRESLGGEQGWDVLV
jgi:hypothetical protein